MVVGVGGFFSIAAASLLSVTCAIGCSSTLETYYCSTGADCQSDEREGVCEESKVCSFSDDECVSGRRYGKLSAEMSQQCVPLLEVDASVADAATIDARPALIDAEPPKIDAEPPMIDAGLVCPTTREATSCPSVICPIDEGMCCVYITLSNTIDCTDTCAAVGLTCSSAAGGDGTCTPLNPHSCGNKDLNNLCFCQ